MTETRTKNRRIVALAVDLAVVVLALIGTGLSASRHGWKLFQYYTQDSNLLAAVALGICAFFEARGLRTGAPVPRWSRTLQYVGTCCLMVTFVVVVVVLAPMLSNNLMYSLGHLLFWDSMLYHHLLCPLLALASFLLLNDGTRLGRKQTLLAVAPTLVYGLGAIALNLLRLMEGPYPFLMVYEQPAYMSVVWAVVMFLGAYGLAWLLRVLLNRRQGPKA